MSHAASPHAAVQQFEAALAHHQAGRLDQAAALYRQVLESLPGHADSIHLLGVVLHQQGRHEEAVRQILEAIRLQPRNAAYHSNLGLAYRALGRRDESAAALTEALRVDPAYAGARRNLATVLGELGRCDEAAALLRELIDAAPQDAGLYKSLGAILLRHQRPQPAVEALTAARALKPDDVETLNNLGLALRDCRRLSEAERVLRAAVKAHPDHADSRNHLALVLADTGRFAEAAAEYQIALKIDPEHVWALSNLAVSLKALGRNSEAVALLQRCLKIQPDHVGALNNLGELLNKLGRHHDAVASLRRAVQLDPQSCEAHNNLGLAYKELDQQSLAQQHLERALACNPRYQPALVNLGNSLVAQGRVEEAVRHVRAALELEPESVPAWYALASYGKYRFSPEETAELRRLLARPHLSDEDRGSLHYALCACLDKSGPPDEAFYHAGEANRLRRDDYRRQGLVFDPAKHEALVDAIVETFTADYFSEVRPWGESDPLPTFVVGMPRSATTLTEQILCSHSQVHGAGELNDLGQLEYDLPALLGADLPAPRCLARDRVENHRDRLAELSARHLARLRSFDSTALRVVDKMTLNFLRLGLTYQLFPGASFLHCRRDPRDTCLSCFFHNFAKPGLLFTFSIEHLAEYYVQYERVMEHWKRVLPAPVLEVAYDDLLDDPEGRTRRMIDFLGLPWEDRCLAFHENDRLVKTASAAQVREPIHRRSQGRWQRYAEQLAPLVQTIEAGRRRYGLTGLPPLSSDAPELR